MKEYVIKCLLVIIVCYMSPSTQAQVIVYEKGKATLEERCFSAIEPVKDRVDTVSSNSSIQEARIEGLQARLGDQSSFFSISIGVLSVLLTLISIGVGFFVFKQSRKVDEIYRTYSTKLNDLSKNQLDFTAHSLEIDRQRTMIQAVKNSLKLETIHYSAETLLSKVYQLIFKLDKAIKEYNDECKKSEGDVYQELCESKSAIAKELATECRDYCEEAIIKLKHIKGSLRVLEDGSLRDELEMKLKSTWVRAYVASALIYKRWVLPRFYGRFKIALNC